MSKSTYISLLIAGLLLSCGDDVSSDNTPATSGFISATPVRETSLETLKSLAMLAGQDDVADLLNYGVTTYTVTYETTYNGNSITASGLLYLPKDLQGNAPLISLQHGTTFIKDDAPSVAGELTGMELFASAGYIAIMPDYIGYGESEEIFHPYYDEQTSARSVIDMITSTKKFLQHEKIGFNDKLFLAGYSEGGFVTLAAAKAIESDPSLGLTITAVAAGAGGYDLTEMLKGVTTETQYAYPSYLAFVLMAYNNTYQWNKPLTYFFRDKYATALSTYMNGQYSGSYINARLTTSVEDLFNPDFYQRLKTEDGEAELKQALQDNSVSGWNTNLPIRLYHGTNDEIIPYHNSEVTLQNFKTLGSENITLIAIPGGDHGSSFMPMLEDFIPWFETLR
jgi:pimeloyl-ACP methyl ester carboxylesterase